MFYPFLYNHPFLLRIANIYWEYLVNERVRRDDPTVRLWYQAILWSGAFDFLVDVIPLTMAEVERETRQLIMPVVDAAQIPSPAAAGTEAGHQPPQRLVGVSPTLGQPGEVRSCPVGLGDCTSQTPTAPAERSAPVASIAAPPPSDTRPPGGGSKPPRKRRSRKP